jgi:hypothetical protein
LGRTRNTVAACALVSLALAAAALAVTGCSETPTLVPNQSPTITLTSGPVDTVSAPQTWIVDIAWSANDPDGSIERFDYAIDPPTYRQAFANRAETTWISTRESRVTVRFRASTPDSIGPGATASDFHTFVCAPWTTTAVFRRWSSARSMPIPSRRIFRSRAPHPRDSSAPTWKRRFACRGPVMTPDGAGSRQPVGYRVRILESGASGEVMTYLLDPDSLRRVAIETNWAGWISVPGESTSVVVDDARLVAGAEALAAVVAVDEAGATTPYMSLERNLLSFGVVADAPPRLHIWSPAIDYTSVDGRIDSGMEILASQPHTLHWEASASPGQRIVSTRWMLNGNINDPTPRSDEATDWPTGARRRVPVAVRRSDR